MMRRRPSTLEGSIEPTALWAAGFCGSNTTAKDAGRSYMYALPHAHARLPYAISQQKRKLVEQSFGWMKTIGGLRKLRHRGGPLVDWIFTFTAAAYNIVRMRRLLPATP